MILIQKELKVLGQSAQQSVVDDGDISILTKENNQVNQVDDIITANSSPRKQFIAVEILSKSKPNPRVRNSPPLKEIAVEENIPTRDSSPDKSLPRQVTPEPVLKRTAHEDEENVVLANVPPITPSRQAVREKVAVSMSPARPMNVASILAKSPNRPIYRVGLSRRVNVEPLHGYLKKNV